MTPPPMMATCLDMSQPRTMKHARTVAAPRWLEPMNRWFYSITFGYALERAMRLRHIEIFQAILQTGSVTGAAGLLNVSQPAASKALQHAEAQLGFTLFRRVRGQLLPTPEARILEQSTARVFEELQRARRLAGGL